MMHETVRSKLVWHDLFIVLTIPWLLFPLSCSHRASTLSASMETAQDAPWADIARESESNPNASFESILKQRSPALLEDMQKDAEQTVLKNIWGFSANYDRTARKSTVQPSIIRSILEFMQLPPLSGPKNIASHAGAIHTYGYLFSNISTSHGFKRARWVAGTLESGLGLPDHILSPNPSEGTLFSNASYFFARFALHDDPALQTLLQSLTLPESLEKFPYQKLPMQRVEEIIEGESLTLRTDLVMFPHQARDPKMVALLLYSVKFGPDAAPLLITGFPVAQSVVDDLLDPKNFGANQSISLRYNIHIEGLSDSNKRLSGVRQLVRVPLDLQQAG